VNGKYRLHAVKRCHNGHVGRTRRSATLRPDASSDFRPRGDGIQPRTLEVFDDLGIIDDVLTRGSLPPIIHAHRGGKFVGEL
jgi:hypothetical protein